MKRRFVRAAAFWLALVLMVGCVTGVGAHNGETHARQIKQVLFGRYAKDLNEQQKGVWEAFGDVTAIALDQMDGSDQDLLVGLRDKKIKHLPKSVEEINNKGGRNHRQYTHMGWDVGFVVTAKNRITITEKDEQELRLHWQKRKEMMIITVNHYLDFGIKGKFARLVGMNDKLLDKKCNSFAAMLYYIHLLGDHQSEDEGKEYNDVDKMVLVSRNGRAEASVVSELEKHLSILFEDQCESTKYNNLTNRIDEWAKEARKAEIDDQGNPVTDDDLKIIKKCASEILRAMMDNIPGLLRNEDFFKEGFK